MKDMIRFEVLEDGTLKFTTDEIGPANHASADELLEQLEDAMGGSVTVKKRPRLEGHVQTHQHGHVHQR